MSLTASLRLSGILLASGIPLFAEAEPPIPAPETPRIVSKTPATPFDAPPGSWTIVALPDTQNYSDRYPDVFLRQTDWIALHARSHIILFVTHEGDITNNNTPTQWLHARAALDRLVSARVPFLLSTGNHDYGPKGNASVRETKLNDSFTTSDYTASTSHGVFEPGKVENSWHELHTPSGPFLALGLEFSPRDEVLAWAAEVIAAHPDHKVIITTHAYLSSDGTRFDWQRKGEAQPANPLRYPIGANDGEGIWRKLAAKFPNVLLVLCGHATGPGTGYLKSEGEHGNPVHQILANYQIGTTPYRGNGGGGYLRLLRFLPDGKTLQIHTYSPLYDQWLDDPANRFDIDL